MKKHLLLILLIAPSIIFAQKETSKTDAEGEEFFFQSDAPRNHNAGAGFFVEKIKNLEHFFPHPGLVGRVNGRWEGTDHLLNLDKGIELYVEILNSSGTSGAIDEKKVYETLTEIFKKGNLLPYSKESNPPLPFFHMFVMVTKVDDQYVVYVEGRLFESVILERFILDDNTKFQAVTWERQSLNTFSSSLVEEEVAKAVAAIGEEFVERFRFYKQTRPNDMN